MVFEGPTLQTTLQNSIDEVIATVIEATPVIFGAAVILVIGWFVGRIVFRVVANLADRIELDRLVLETPLGRMLGGTERAVSQAFGRVSAWFIYALAILAAAEVLAIDSLSAWLSQAVSYLPSLLAGGLIIVGGFVLADFLADAMVRTEAVTGTGYTEWIAEGARLFLYFVVLVIGLDTMGVSVEILNTFATAVAFGFAAGIALAIGIAFGWGGKDFVAENIDSWTGRAGDRAVPVGQTDGGTDE
jgi:hypothetical protein